MMIHSRAMILLALVAVVAAIIPIAKPLDSDDGTLELVQVVIRHGDRAAQDQFATDKSGEVLFRGLGELSDDGIDHAHMQGKDFRKRYAQQYKIYDDRFIPSQVRVRASGLSRVLMSAGSFTNALFRKTPAGNPVVPPIYTIDFNDDPLLAPAMTCTNGWDDIIKALNLTSRVAVASTSLTAMEQQMWPCKDVPSIKADAIVAELPNKLITMPDEYNNCATMPAKKFMYDYIELLGGGGDHFNEERLKRTVGMLTTELLNNMYDKKTCGKNPEKPCQTEKFRVYYSHDVNVLALSYVFKSMDAFNKVTPAFSSALVFELWKKTAGKYNVKIFLKDGQNTDFVKTQETELDVANEYAKKYAITEKMRCDQPTDAEMADYIKQQQKQA